MSFDLDALKAAVARHQRVTRVVIADLRGSSPREVGAAMLVWQDGQSGTIGGGALEFAAAQAARDQRETCRLTRHALGPELGQCCGGAVSLLSETYDARAVAALEGEVIARPIAGAAAMPLAVRRILATARDRGVGPEPALIEGWMVEPVTRPTRDLWIWGAGHVGRALVDVLAPLPDLAITWVDTGPERFPEVVPEAVTVLPAAHPADLARHAPVRAEHLIVTYSHALDLELCHRLLSHGFGFAGLIGSATKWARFRSRLRALGHAPEQIARITCPIGDPGLGKHPQQIAIGVAAQLMRQSATTEQTKERRA
ncbi:MAG: xanthine dehydrogenase accessory protein XdhC [Pseudodonghicola sp.]|nr:xanthine dehydrogenase accessory protein XdhC [Pseudodonghicola sp.]